jgi:hypothetical protein
MKSRAKRQTRAAERPPIPTIAGSIRMGSPALLEPGTGVGKRDGVSFGQLRGLLTHGAYLTSPRGSGLLDRYAITFNFDLDCC